MTLSLAITDQLIRNADTYSLPGPSSVLRQ